MEIAIGGEADSEVEIAIGGEADSEVEIAIGGEADSDVEIAIGGEADSDVEIPLDDGADSGVEIMADGADDSDVEAAGPADSDVAAHLDDSDATAGIELDDGVLGDDPTTQVDSPLAAADEDDEEIDISVTAGEEPVAEEEIDVSIAAGEEPVAEEEIDVSIAAGEEPVADDDASQSPLAAAVGLEPLGDALDVEPDAAADEVPEVEAPAAPASASAMTPAQTAEDLEEADFYFQQGMHAEAKEIYDRILSLAPHHPQALLRVGEIEAAKGTGQEEAEAADAAAEVLPGGVDLGADDLFDTGDEAPGDAADDEIADPATADEDEISEPLAADDGEVSDPDAAAPAGDALGELDEDTGPLSAEPEPDVESVEATAEEVAAPEPQAAAQPSVPPMAEAEITAPVLEAGSLGAEEEDGFDLAAQLSDVFDLEDSRSGDPAIGLGRGTEEEGFEQVFAAFKQGVEGALDAGDFEAHYDLGIAYREMGLVEDAITEFNAAMGDESRKLACLHMMGLCAFDLGRMADAVAHLEQALALPEVPDDQLMALRFDLGRAHASLGDVERARSAFEAVQANDPDFQDVASQLEALEEIASDPVQGPGEPEPEAEQAEAFENFDEFVTDPPQVEEEPEYESFDDLMGDDDDDESDEAPEDDDPVSAEVAGVEPKLSEPEPSLAQDVDPGAEPSPGDETLTDTESPKGKPAGRRRKKKISFV